MSRQLVPQLVTEDEQTRALRLEVRDFLRQDLLHPYFLHPYFVCPTLLHPHVLRLLILRRHRR